MKTAAIGIGLLFISAAPGWGQGVCGTIVGTVSDPSGAAVPNARVIITDRRHYVAQATATNESGNFTQHFLIVGQYRVRVEAGA